MIKKILLINKKKWKFLIFIISSTQYYITKLNWKKNAKCKQKKTII